MPIIRIITQQCNINIKIQRNYFKHKKIYNCKNEKENKIHCTSRKRKFLIVFLNIESIIESIVEYLPFVKYFLIYCQISFNKKNNRDQEKLTSYWPSFALVRESFCLLIKSIPDRSLFELLSKSSRLERYSGSSVCVNVKRYIATSTIAHFMSQPVRYHLELSFSRRLLLATMYIQYRDEFEEKTYNRNKNRSSFVKIIHFRQLFIQLFLCFLKIKLNFFN